MEVSVIIPTYNKAAYLELTLESLVHQTYDRRQYEVVVTDDGCTDETAQVLERYAALDWNIRAVQQPHAGRSVARNTAIQNAQGRILLFVDDDGICCRDLIATHVALHTGASRKAVVGMRREVFTHIPDTRQLLAGFVREAVYGLSEDVAAESIDNIVASLPNGFNVVSVEDVVQNMEKIHQLSVLIEKDRPEQLQAVMGGAFACPWLFFITSHVSVDRSATLEVGLFDERFKGWGVEDVELGYRLFRAGVVFDATLDTLVYHQVHPRNRVLITKQGVRNYMRYCEKHQDPAIYLEWQLLFNKISMKEYEAKVRQIHAGLLSADEERAIKEAYDQFIGRS